MGKGKRKRASYDVLRAVPAMEAAKQYPRWCHFVPRLLQCTVCCYSADALMR